MARKQMKKRKGKDYTEAFKWANAELETGRSIIAIVSSWGGTFEQEIIDYFEGAKEAGQSKIVEAMRKEYKTIQEYESKH